MILVKTITLASSADSITKVGTVSTGSIIHSLPFGILPSFLYAAMHVS